jgi:translocation and assembly module TamB
LATPSSPAALARPAKNPRKWAPARLAGYDRRELRMARKSPRYRRKPRRDWGRLAAQFLCLLFGLFGAVPFGVGLVVRTSLVRDWGAQKAAVALERELGLVAHYRVAVQAWPFAVTLSDAVVEGSDGLGPVLEAKRISVRPRLFALLAGQIDAGHIEVDAPHLRVVVREGKLANLEYRLPPAKPGKPTRYGPFRTIAVTDAAIDAEVDGTKLTARDVDVDVSSEEGPIYEIAVRAGEQLVVRSRPVLSIEPAAPNVLAVDEDVLCRLDARIRWGKGSVLVRRFTLLGAVDEDPRPGTAPSCALPDGDPRRIELSLAHVQAAWPAGDPPEVEGAVKMRAPLMLVNRFVPMPPLNGFVTVDVEGRYQKTLRLPILRGKIEGKGIELERYRLMSELTADIAIDGESIHSENTSIGFADGTLLVHDLVVEPLKKGIPLRIGAIDATNVGFAALMRDLGVTPHAHVEWLFRTTHVGAIDGALSPLRLDAEFSCRTSDFEVFDSAVDDPRRMHMVGVKDARATGHVAVRPDAVIFRDSQIDFGDSHLEASVSLGFHNDISLTIHPASRVDLANISPIAKLKTAGHSIFVGQMTGKFKDPILAGQLSVTGLALNDFPLGDVTSSNVRFRPLIVDFTDIHAKKDKSVFDVPTARLDFDGPAVLVADASVDASDLYLRDFLNMWHFDADPRFDEIDGRGRTRASIHYELGGPGDICGNGLLNVRGGVHFGSADLFGEHYDKLDSDFTYLWTDRDAADQGIDVDIRSMTLKKGRGTLFGSGTIRRGGVIRAEIAADDVPLSRLSALSRGGRLLEGSASAVGTLSGTIEELAADVDVRLSPLRLGSSQLPASALHVALVPVKKEVHVIGKTRCGGPITAPFDRAEFDRDVSSGTFLVNGQLFDGQVTLDDLKITRQRERTASGNVGLHRLDLSSLGALAKASAAGEGPAKRVSGFLSAALDISSLRTSAPQKMRATLKLAELELRSAAGALALERASPPITIGDDRLVLPPLDWEFRAGTGLKGTVRVAGEVERLSAGGEMNLSAAVAPFDISAMGSAFPRIERAGGTLEATLSLKGKLDAPVYAGEARLRKGELSLRGLAMPISEADVAVAIGGDEIRVLHGSARFGGGTLTVSGHAPIHGFKIGDVSGAVSARGVSVPVADGIEVTCDADLRGEWAEREPDEEEAPLPRISGDVMLTSFSYTRPIGISADLGALAQRGRRKSFDAYDPAEDFLTFDVKLRSREPLRLRNNLVETQLVIDSDAVVLSGTNQRFGLRGRMRLIPGGHVRLRANDFEVRQGFVRFDDPSRIAPHVDVTAVTDYHRYSTTATGGTATAAAGGGSSTVGRGGSYRITLHAYGDADNLRLDMTSDPSLSQEDIVLLLTIGMTHAEIDQLQASSLGGTAALEALSSLTGADTAVRKAVPVIDDFRFGSAYSSRTGRTEPTVTLGKRLTDQVRANVTSGLSEDREIRSNVEWKLTPRVSVQGSYDNVNDVSSSALGNLGADVRFRLEFE